MRVFRQKRIGYLWKFPQESRQFPQVFPIQLNADVGPLWGTIFEETLCLPLSWTVFVVTYFFRLQRPVKIPFRLRSAQPIFSWMHALDLFWLKFRRRVFSYLSPYRQFCQSFFSVFFFLPKDLTVVSESTAEVWGLEKNQFHLSSQIICFLVAVYTSKAPL